MKPVSILVRTDASNIIGTGHVVRCLTIADQLTKLGANVEFVCRTLAGNLITLISNKGYKVHELSITENQHQSQWLGSSIKEDYEQVLNTIQNLHFDWVIVDNYALDLEWENEIRKKIAKILVIDDLANRPHNCDILLDQNFLGDLTKSRYDQLVPRNCRKLLGPEYALLNTSYKELRKSLTPKDGTLKKILVFLGGADLSNETSKVLEALSDQRFDSIKVTVILGKNHPNPLLVRDQANKRKNTEILENLPDLSAQMISADLMIGAGGTTTWERMCLGLPSIVMSIADNQKVINQALSQAGMTTYLGTKEDVTIPQIKNAIITYLENPSQLREENLKITQLVDGEGAEIVGSILMSKGKL